MVLIAATFQGLSKPCGDWLPRGAMWLSLFQDHHVAHRKAVWGAPPPQSSVLGLVAGDLARWWVGWEGLQHISECYKLLIFRCNCWSLHVRQRGSSKVRCFPLASWVAFFMMRAGLW